MAAQSRGHLRGPALCLLLVLAAAGCAAAAPSVSPSAIRPTPPDPTPVPGGPATTAASSLDPAGFQLPQPVCPAPDAEAAAPTVTVAIRDEPPVAATAGSATLSTCNTTSVTDTVGSEPTVVLSAQAGDEMTIAVPPGWSILAWEGSDHATMGEGINVLQGVAANPGPTIVLPTPGRPGPSEVALTLSVMSDGGQVVGTVEAQFQINLE